MGCTQSASAGGGVNHDGTKDQVRTQQAPTESGQGRSRATSGNTTDSAISTTHQLSAISALQHNSRNGHKHSVLTREAYEPGAAAVAGTAGAEKAYTERSVSETSSVVRQQTNWELQFSELAVENHIANGGYCTVLSCVLYGRRRAVKIPLANCADPEGAIADLINEIDVLKRLRHPHLCAIHGAGGVSNDPKDMPFLVLERLLDKNLSQQLGTDVEDTSMRAQMRARKIRSKYPFRRRLELGLQLLQLLRYLHWECLPNGFVVHRDLKPSNLGISEDGQLKVFDFGLARLMENRDELTDKYVMTGQTGSQRFMAPEVFEGMPYNEKVDIFSFGIVMWELCSLQKPFAGMTAHQHARKVFKQGFRPVVDRRWPQGLGPLLQRCWHQDPDMRPDATQATDRLAEIVDRVHSSRHRGAFDKL